MPDKLVATSWLAGKDVSKGPGGEVNSALMRREIGNVAPPRTGTQFSFFFSFLFLFPRRVIHHKRRPGWQEGRSRTINFGNGERGLYSKEKKIDVVIARGDVLLSLSLSQKYRRSVWEFVAFIFGWTETADVCTKFECTNETCIGSILGKKYLENRCTGIRRINPFAHLVANYFLSTSNCRYVCIYVFSFSFKGSKRFLFLSLLVRETLSMEILRLWRRRKLLPRLECFTSSSQFPISAIILTSATSW